MCLTNSASKPWLHIQVLSAQEGHQAVPEGADVLHTELGRQDVLFKLADILLGADAARPNCDCICVEVEVTAKAPEETHQQLPKVCSLSSSLHTKACVALPGRKTVYKLASMLGRGHLQAGRTTERYLRHTTPPTHSSTYMCNSKRNAD